MSLQTIPPVPQPNRVNERRNPRKEDQGLKMIHRVRASWRAQCRDPSYKLLTDFILKDGLQSLSSSDIHSSLTPTGLRDTLRSLCSDEGIYSRR